MKYEREIVDSSVFKDILPDGAEMYMRPQLPTIEFEINNTKYKVTDLRCLNETAVNCFVQILNTVCNTPDCKEVSFITNIDKNELDLIADILTSIDYEFRKGGKNGYSQKSVLLVTSYMYEETKDGTVCVFNLIKDHAKVMYDYAQSKKKIGYYELVMAVAEYSYKQFQKFSNRKGSIKNDIQNVDKTISG